MAISCFKVSDTGFCRYCFKSTIIKNGKTKTGKQQYYCKNCNKRFIDYYSYQAYLPLINKKIIELTRNGMGLRNTAAFLKISATTLIKRIFQIADEIKRPVIVIGKTYEVDEMKSFIKKKKKKIWITYALERGTNRVISFNIGSRTKKTIKTVIDTLLLSSARKIYTDGWSGYQSLIPRKQHSTWLHGTNHIERNNLNVRIHLKRLNRRTICFSRSKAMLEACLKIYFWG